MKLSWQYCSDPPAFLIFLKNCDFSGLNCFPLSPSQCKITLPFSLHLFFRVTPSMVFPRCCGSLQSRQNWFTGVLGNVGRLGLVPSGYSPGPKCCVACQQQLPVRWEHACLASQRKQRPKPPQVPWVYPHISWAQIFLTSHAHPRPLCPPWPPSQPFL